MFPIEAFQNTLTKAVRILESLKIRFHLTGGIATVAYGEPRMTQDIDVVIENSSARNQIDELLTALAASDFIFDEAALRTAIESRQMFQLLDRVESLKLDIYPREMIPGELGRSTMIEIFEGQFLPVASRADTAASKLAWAAKGSHKSRRDFRLIWSAASSDDQALISELADQLNLSRLLHELVNESDELI